MKLFGKVAGVCILVLAGCIIMGTMAQAQSKNDNKASASTVIYTEYAQGLNGPQYIRQELLRRNYPAAEVDNALASCNIDWNNRAIKAIEKMAQTVNGGVSKMGVGAFLVKVGYTNEQILYAIDNCQLDWNRNAQHDAIFLVQKDGEKATETSVRDFLQKLGYTPDQVEFGVQHRLEPLPAGN